MAPGFHLFYLLKKTCCNSPPTASVQLSFFSLDYGGNFLSSLRGLSHSKTIFHQPQGGLFHLLRAPDNPPVVSQG